PGRAGRLVLLLGARRPFRTSWLTVGMSSLEDVLTQQRSAGRHLPTERGMVAKTRAERETAQRTRFDGHSTYRQRRKMPITVEMKPHRRPGARETAETTRGARL